MIWPLSKPCSGGGCPTVYVDDVDPSTVILQGDRLSVEAAAELGELPDHETALRVPRALIVEAYERLTKDPR
jgi:hypothetical protein